jgi:heme-degrading monooxygenase HmoA
MTDFVSLVGCPRALSVLSLRSHSLRHRLATWYSGQRKNRCCALLVPSARRDGWYVRDSLLIGVAGTSPAMTVIMGQITKGTPMVLEIAQIDVKPGMEAEFEAGVAKAAPLFKRAKGCSSMALQKSVEKPSRYRLFVGWATVENHTVDFRSSADFQEWRKLVGHCFASPPEVEHVQEVVKGF